MLLVAPVQEFSAPIPVHAERWVTPDDMPMNLIGSQTGVWMVAIRVTVAPDGKVRDCKNEAISKIPALNSLTCKNVLRRAQFEPARIGGIPVFGVYRTAISYAVADYPIALPKIVYPDIDLTVKSLPAGRKSPIAVRVMFAVDAAGSKSSCVADNAEEADRAANDTILVPVACGQIIANYPATPASDSGKPVSSVQNAWVRFSTTPSK